MFVLNHIKYFGFWLCTFIVARLIFVIYHLQTAKAVGTENILNAFKHGVLLDLSVAGYFSLIPFLLLAISELGSGVKFKSFFFKTIKLYTILFVVFATALVTIDLELYGNWGYRLDDSFLKYLSSPTEATASISTSPVFTLLGLLIGFSWVLMYVFSHYFFKNELNFAKKAVYTEGSPKPEKKSQMVVIQAIMRFIVCILLFFFLIIPIRGGLQLAPINQSSVYFSTKTFANHAAVNCVWNFLISTFENSADAVNPFIYSDQKEAENTVKQLFETDEFGNKLNDTSAINSTTFLINPNQKTNVIIITYESLTAKVIERLSSKYKGVTPSFDSLCREGVLFSNIFAAGDRTDKGLLGVLSGHPAMPKVSIIETPRKSTQLPVLSNFFNKNGYSTSFYYGGETEFANMKSYLMNGGFSKITDKTAFAKADLSSKWGAFDHVVFRRVNSDLAAAKPPFFVNLLTLSSHEPFEVPVDWQQKNEPQLDSEDDKFIRVHQYSDAALGEFIRTAKQSSWWKNTLIIIIADHSSQRLEPKNDVFEQFHIPMLWLGGALTTRDTTVETIGSQADIAATLLAQLAINQNSSFQFSKNILDKKQPPFAYFAFRQGFGFVQKNGRFVFDTEGSFVRQQSGTVDSSDIKKGKAYLQTTFQNYLSY